MKRQYNVIATGCMAALMAVTCAAADATAQTAKAAAPAAQAKSAYMARAQWNALVSACAQDPALLQQTIVKIAPEEQSLFLAAVNAAIAKMPGSDEARCAAFVKANEAACIGAASVKNMAAVLATTFATVPTEYLTEINERFAKDLVARNASTTDARMTSAAENVVKAVVAACRSAESAGVRETFAVLMMLRAANGSPKDLQDKLLALLPDEKTRTLAKNEWIGPALGAGQEQSYDPMLGAAQAGDEPDHTIVASITGASDIRVSMLADLEAGTSAAKMGGGAFIAPGTVAGSAPSNDPSDIGLNRIPRMLVEQKTDANGDENPYYTGRRGKTPGGTTGGGGGGGYDGQTMRSF